MWMMLTWLCAGMGCTNYAPANLGKKRNVSNVLAAIKSTVITQQIMTELSSGFNSIGFGASDQVKTIELSWSSSVLHLETTSGMLRVFQSYWECMFFDWCLLHNYDRWWQWWWFGNFGAKKNKNPAMERRSIWHIISNPLDPTRRTSEDTPIHLSYPPYSGMALELCTCGLFTPTTCSFICYCRAWNLTWHVHFDHTRSALSTVTSRLRFN